VRANVSRSGYHRRSRVKTVLKKVMSCARVMAFDLTASWRAAFDGLKPECSAELRDRVGGDDFVVHRPESMARNVA